MKATIDIDISSTMLADKASLAALFRRIGNQIDDLNDGIRNFEIMDKGVKIGSFHVYNENVNSMPH